MVNVEEIAKELLKQILPTIQNLQNQINDLNKRMDIVQGKIQALNSVLMNKRKHGE